MNKKEFLKLLRSNRKLYAYVVYNEDCSDYFQQMKSEWIAMVSREPDMEYNVTFTDHSIYIN